jgi:hypothetical protein
MMELAILLSCGILGENIAPVRMNHLTWSSISAKRPCRITREFDALSYCELDICPDD